MKEIILKINKFKKEIEILKKELERIEIKKQMVIEKLKEDYEITNLEEAKLKLSEMEKLKDELEINILKLHKELEETIDGKISSS